MNDRDCPEIVLINGAEQRAVLADGRVVPVTHWFDLRGALCEPEDAASCVAGADNIGWFAIDLQNFNYAVVH